MICIKTCKQRNEVYALLDQISILANIDQAVIEHTKVMFHCFRTSRYCIHKLHMAVCCLLYLKICKQNHLANFYILGFFGASWLWIWHVKNFCVIYLHFWIFFYSYHATWKLKQKNSKITMAFFNFFGHANTVHIVGTITDNLSIYNSGCQILNPSISFVKINILHT